MVGIGIGIGQLIGTGRGKIIVCDSFNRANNTTSLGNADTGQTWVANVGTWGIIGNRAYTPTSGSLLTATVESRLSDAIITALIAVAPTEAVTNAGVVFRLVNATNYWRVVQDSTTTYLQKNVAGVLTNVGTFALAKANNTELKIRAVGNSIQVFANGTQLLNVTDSTHNTATKHGLNSQINITARFDNFKVEGI